jgi:hypothetical protein
MTDNTHTTTDLEQVLTIQDTQQIIEEEQRTTTHENAHVDAPIDNIPTMNDYVMNIAEVTARNILQTPVIITTVAWNSTQTTGTNLYGFNIPDIFTTLKNFHDTMLTTYSAFKPTIKIHFKLNSTPFHQGKVLCWYNPLNQLGPYPLEKSISLTSISMMPSVFLDASLANSGDILIPFEFYKTYFNTNSDSGLPPMGGINITVFNELISGSGASTAATIQVLLSCEDLQLHIPITPHTVLFSSGTIMNDSLPSPRINGKLQTEPQVLQAIGEGIGKIKDGAIATKNAIGTAYGNFKTGNFSGGFESVGKGFESVGSIFKVFNMDKPAIIDATYSNCIYPASPLAHMRGVDSSVRLGAAPEGGYLTHELFSSTAGSEHLIQHLTQMKGFHDTTRWQTTDVPGTVLGVIPVAPWYSPTGQTITVGTDTYYGLENTFLSYLAAFFTFWRGSISFRWDFVSSKMHSGRLGFIFFPNDDPMCKYGSSPSSLDITLVTNNPIYYFDLAESKTAELTVPFQSGTHMKWMLPARYRTAAGNTPPVQLENYLTGTIAIVVINQLMAPNSVVQYVDFNSFVGAGSDFEFEAPTAGDFGYFYEDLGNPIPSIVLQTEPQSLEDPQPTRSQDTHPTNFLFKSGGPTKRLDAYNEHIDDVRDITRRYTIKDTVALPMLLNPTTGYYEGNISIFNSPTSLTESATTTSHLRYQSFLARICEMFAFWHGSIRYKILPYVNRDSNLQLATSYNYAPAYINSTTGPASVYGFLQNTGDPVTWTNVSQQSALEVELPYYSVYTQLATSLISTPYTGTPIQIAPQCYGTGWLTIQARTSTTSALRTADDLFYLDLHILHSGGDDIAFSLPVAPPQTYFL